MCLTNDNWVTQRSGKIRLGNKRFAARPGARSARVARAGVLAAAVWLVAPGTAPANNLHYHENFATTQYEDTLNTTARWDTVGAQLRMFPHPAVAVGSYNTPGLAYDVAVAGDYVYLADNSDGIRVIDISDPTNPTSLASLPLFGNTRGVAVSGDHLYAAVGTGGLQVIDILNVSNPWLAGTYNTPGTASSVALSGKYAFVADGASGLQVIDISSPSSPVLAGNYNTAGSAEGVALSENDAFVADGGSGVQVIDISNPAAPSLVATISSAMFAHGVAVSGNTLFVAADAGGLQMFDVSNPAAPVSAGSYATPGLAQGVHVSGHIAFVADDTYGLEVVDIANPGTPAWMETWDTPDQARGVTVAGILAFVADNGSGLQVVQFSNLVGPVLAGTRDTPGLSYDVCVSGRYAFVADAMSGLQVIDIADPAAPAIVGSYDTPDVAGGVTVSGDHAFVADGASGLEVIDVSDPTAPALAGSWNSPGNAFKVSVSGDVVYVADGTSGLHAIDVSNPASPGLLGSLGTAGAASDVVLSGGLAIVAEDASGISLIDVSNPTSLALVGSYATAGRAQALAVDGDHLYVADGASGLQVISIRVPSAPSLEGAYAVSGFARGVAATGNRVALDSGPDLFVIDVSNPAAPVLNGKYTAPGNLFDMALAGDRAYATGEALGLHVVQVYQAEVDETRDVGRSMALTASADAILRARLSTTQTDSVTWNLSSDDGVTWRSAPSDNSWVLFSVPGNALQWRSTHAWAAPGVNPSVDAIDIEWLVEAAPIDSIADVPDDQGGWATVHFTRSGRDFADEPAYPVVSYGVWRRVDGTALAAAVRAKGMLQLRVGAHLQAGPQVVSYEGRRYAAAGRASTASAFPPGTWELVQSVPALQKDTYRAVVPTVADSSGTGTHYTVIVVTTHTTTPSVWYVSAPDSGNSVDNIAPGVPQGFVVAYNAPGGNALSWNASPEPDLQYYRVYRSADPNFTPGPSTLVQSTATPSWTDGTAKGWMYTYRVTAVDYAGNESALAAPGTVTGAQGETVPQNFAVHQNVPNPFNPTTSIAYDIPAGGGRVTLAVYDVSGRRVRTLVDGPAAAGHRVVRWDGRDSHGRAVASGVYFYRLTTDGFAETKNMVLLK